MAPASMSRALSTSKRADCVRSCARCMASPKIEIPAQGGTGLPHPEAVSCERRRDEVVLRGTLVQRAGIEVGAWPQSGLRRLGLRERFAHSGLGLGQGGAVFEPQPNQAIELRVLKGIPPA